MYEVVEIGLVVVERGRLRVGKGEGRRGRCANPVLKGEREGWTHSGIDSLIPYSNRTRAVESRSESTR